MPNYKKLKGSSVTFDVHAKGTLDIYYQWFGPDGEIDKEPQLEKNSLRLSKIKEEDAGCYYCKAYNGIYYHTPSSGYKFLHSDQSPCFNLDVISKKEKECCLNSGFRDFQVASDCRIKNIEFVKIYNSGYTSSTAQELLAKSWDSGRLSTASTNTKYPAQVNEYVDLDIFNMDGPEECDSATGYNIRTGLPGRVSSTQTIQKSGDACPTALIWKVAIQKDKNPNDATKVSWERGHDLVDYYVNELPTGNGQFASSKSYSIPCDCGRSMFVEWEFPEYAPTVASTGACITGYPDFDNNNPSEYLGACALNAILYKTGVSRTNVAVAGITPLAGESFLKSQFYKSNNAIYGDTRKFQDLICYDVNHSGDIAINFFSATKIFPNYNYMVGNWGKNVIGGKEMATGWGGGEMIKNSEASITGNSSLWKVKIDRNVQGSYSSGITTITGCDLTFQDSYENAFNTDDHPTKGVLIDLYTGMPVITHSSKERTAHLHTQSSSADAVVFVVNNVKLISGTLPSNNHYYISNRASFDNTGSGSFNDFNGYFAKASGLGGNGGFHVKSGYGITGSAGWDLHTYEQLPKQVHDDDQQAYGHWTTKAGCEQWMKTTKIVNNGVCLNCEYGMDSECDECWGTSYDCSGSFDADECGCGDLLFYRSREINTDIDNGNGYLQAWGFLDRGATLRADLQELPGGKTFMYGHLLIADLPDGTGSYHKIKGRGYGQAPLFRTYINGIEV